MTPEQVAQAMAAINRRADAQRELSSLRAVWEHNEERTYVRLEIHTGSSRQFSVHVAAIDAHAIVDELEMVLKDRIKLIDAELAQLGVEG